MKEILQYVQDFFNTCWNIVFKLTIYLDKISEIKYNPDVNLKCKRYICTDDLTISDLLSNEQRLIFPTQL